MGLPLQFTYLLKSLFQPVAARDVRCVILPYNGNNNGITTSLDDSLSTIINTTNLCLTLDLYLQIIHLRLQTLLFLEQLKHQVL